MSTIINFIKDIAELLFTIGKMAIKFVEDIIYMIKLLAETVLNLPQYLGFLPASVLSAFMAAMSIVVVYKVLGRTE